MRREFLAGMAALLASALLHAPAFAQSADATSSASASAAAPAPSVPPAKTVKVALKTSKGVIVLELEIERAPITTKNFLRYVDQHRLDGANFYRAMPYGPDDGILQGGDNSRALPPIKHEPTSKTGLTHTDGVVSMARMAPGTARGDFFICVGDLSVFDAGRDGTSDKQGFAAFGHVSEGMDLVRAYFHGPVSKTKGVGPMKGQMLDPPVKIISAKRVE